ncbi:unnamed protein product [Cladocopium goreaui]|uniref:Soluble ligand binding domain-containing protein n=1 Tax=Cladocopium goreaui TaxID=2562237 RepID=A0A9P1FET7_9DINO|nr:unnamed protein product [Cladocopium goreaui]
MQQPLAITHANDEAGDGDLPPLPKATLPKLPPAKTPAAKTPAKPQAVAEAPKPAPKAQPQSSPSVGPTVQVAQENGQTSPKATPPTPVAKPQKVELSENEKRNRRLAEQQRLAELQRKNEFRPPQADRPTINRPVVQATKPMGAPTVEPQPTRPAPVTAPLQPAPVVAQKQTPREKPVFDRPVVESPVATPKPQLAEKKPQPAKVTPKVVEEAKPQVAETKPQPVEKQPLVAAKKPQPVAVPAKKSPPSPAAIDQDTAPQVAQQRAPQPMRTPEQMRSLTTPTVQPTPEPRFAEVPAPRNTQVVPRPAPRVAAQAPRVASRPKSVPRSEPQVHMPPFIAQQVAQHVQYGQDLASRGATHSARSEFMRALDVVAHALDAQENSERHRDALREGLTALEEAEELTPHVEQGSAGWRRSVEKHSTPILKSPEAQNIHPFMAMQKYCAFAGQRLVIALGHEASASKALYGMARLELDMESPTTKQATLAGPRAIVLHQAALSIDSNNYEAANELGVLFARYGQYEQARAALLHSIRISPQPISWQNLASVSELLGDRETAHAAKHQQQWLAQKLQQEHPFTTGANAALDVTMLDPITFANLPTGEHSIGAAAPQAPMNGPAQTAFKGEDPAVKKNEKPIVARVMAGNDQVQPPPEQIELQDNHIVYEGMFGPPDAHWAPATMHPRCGVQCDRGQPCNELRWNSWGPIPWEIFAQGEYIGPARLAHVPEYRLRVDDTLEVVYRLTAEESKQPYRFNVGDVMEVSSLSDESVGGEVVVQPDGTITLALLGQVPAADRTVTELRDDIEQRYEQYIQKPAITVIPQKLNNRLLELRATVDNRAGTGGQSRQVKVTPEGTIQLPALGSVFAQGLTLPELRREVNLRYSKIVAGLETTPILSQRAERYVYVVGEVKKSGRYTLEAPTTVIQSIALAGGWNVGAYLDHVVVLRRDENWHLMATKLDLRRALFGKAPCPADDIWIRDSDIVIVPKSPILATTDLIDLVFTRGIYSVIPFTANVSYTNLSSFVPGE